ncbi:MAG TPA: ornithine carbamoyltransferase, partial [Nitrospiria bacterium]|nr:ornithine carbamoyltransferase [Nitrospiria bacterium]
WANSAEVPVINGLTDLHHPCQALGDLMTIREHFKQLKGIRMAYIGDGNNVAHSLIEAASKSGLQIHVASPAGHEPDAGIVSAAKKEAQETGADLQVGGDPAEAARDADVIYTDVWVSMGQEKGARAKAKKFQPFQVNEKLVGTAKDSAIVMHCLPAHRGEEITSSVMDGPQSVIWAQAENRLHAQKAVLEWLLVP